MLAVGLINVNTFFMLAITPSLCGFRASFACLIKEISATFAVMVFTLGTNHY
jgi:hypothetical protein